MPVEIITKNSSDVITDVKRTFGDESDVQIDDSDIIRWINRAQMEIVMRNPEIGTAMAVTDLKSGQADYPILASIPTLLTIQSVHFANRPVKHMEFQEAEQFLMGDDANAPVGNPQFWYERAGVVTFYPVPGDTTINGLKFYYNKRPDDILTNAQILSISDHYYNSVVNYCLEQAYLLNEDVNLASAVSQKFDQGVTLMKERTSSQSDYYPVIGMYDDGADYYTGFGGY